jgi:CHC2 zinc finger
MPAALPADVARRLDKLKPAGDEWIACCPTHEDTTPSLKLRVVEDAKILVYCHAGCDPLAILGALGIEAPASAGEWTPCGEATAIYDYHNEDGKLLFQVLRTADKQLPQRNPGVVSSSDERLYTSVLDDLSATVELLEATVESALLATGQSTQ